MSHVISHCIDYYFSKGHIDIGSFQFLALGYMIRIKLSRNRFIHAFVLYSHALLQAGATCNLSKIYHQKKKKFTIRFSQLSI